MRPSLARVLLTAGVADASTLGQATAIAAEGGVPVVHALLRWRLVAAADVAWALAQALQQEIVSVDTAPVPPPVALTRPMCARLRVVPLWLRGNILGLGMADPTDDDTAEQIAAAFGVVVDRLLVDDDQLEQALRRVFPRPDDVPAARPRHTTTPYVSPSPPPAGPPHPSDVPYGSVSTRSSPPLSTFSSSPGPPLVVPAAIGPDQPIDVVLGEYSSLDVRRVPEAGPEMFVDASLEGSPVDPPSDVFTDQTIDMPQPQLVARSSRPLRETAAADVARVRRRGEENAPDPLDEPTKQLPQPSTVATLDATVPNPLVPTVRLLVVVAHGPTATLLREVLTSRSRELVLLARIEEALNLVSSGRTFDEIVVIDPISTTTASQQLAALAAKARRGILVVSANPDFARLPGVRRRPRRSDSELAAAIVERLEAIARG